MPVHERLTHLQSVAQQLAIERAHQMELLLNPTNEELELEDEELIMEVAEYICRTRCVCVLYDCSTAACGVRCHCCHRLSNRETRKDPVVLAGC